MSSASSEADNFSSTEDIELKEYGRRSNGYSDSGSSADFTTSSRRSIKENETEEDEVNDVCTTSLNTRDKKHHEFDIEWTSLSSMKDTSPKDLNRTRKSSAFRKASALTSKASSLEGPLTRSRPSQDCLERPSSKLAAPMDPQDGSLTRRLSCVDPLEGPSSRMASSLDPLNGPSTGSVFSVDPLEGPSTQTVWFPDSTDDSLTSICKSCHSERETNEPSDSGPPTEPNGSCFRTLADFLRRSSRQIRRSKCYLLFNMALLVLPFSAGYMGSRYEKLCDACQDLPMFVLGLGYFGVILITLRIASILSKYHFTPPVPRGGFNTVLTGVFMAFSLFLMYESHANFSCDPVFTPSKANKKFCIKVFYDYTYYLNEIIPAAFILLILIHIPGWFDPAEDEEE